MTNDRRSCCATRRLAGLAGAIGVAVLIGLAGGPAAAQGTPEQRQACEPDAMRLCSEFILDVDRITACMVKKRVSLSPACRAVFSRGGKKKPRKGT